MNQNSTYKNILFLGDITGRLGRYVVRDLIEAIKNQNFNSNEILEFEADFETVKNVDFFVANCENASGGFGLTKKNYDDLCEYGLQALTSGNHIWDKSEMFDYANTAERLVCPINASNELPGVRLKCFDIGNYKLAVLSVLGRTFMPPVNSFWEMLPSKIEEIKSITPNILIDFHAEATAEKICFGKWASELGVSCVFGTHTHVQTADEQIFNNKTAYITDAGFCGAKNSVIGMEYEASFKKLSLNLPTRNSIVKKGIALANGVIATVDMMTGCAIKISRLKFVKKYNNEDNNMNKES